MYALWTFHVENDMSYRYDQVLTYEVARELINSHIADCSAAMADEEARAMPRPDRLDRLHSMQTELFHARENMDMTDDQAMKGILTKYRRKPIRRMMGTASD